MGAPRSRRTAVLAPSRERIREAAKTLFTERGYEGTSTAAICRLARTSQSQLIKHFTSKQGVLKEMASREELVTGIHPQALRSALMGAVEGLLRDQLLARTSRFPASYSEADMRAIFAHFLSSCVNQ